MKKIFIDGRVGTTGLRIYERLENRKDIQLITLSEEDRKDTECRKKALNEADVAFLCLPDAAAVDAVGLIENPNTVVIDTSTAHRCDDRFTYGFPELDVEIEEKIKTSKRISVPGCHASGFIALVRPLIKSGIISAKEKLVCHSLTGYSGGGKKMIAEYNDENRSVLLDSPRQYGVTQQHKHLKEMHKFTGLDIMPIFCPIVADFYSGMEVTVPLFAEGDTIEKIKSVYREKYTGSIVKYAECEDLFLPANKLSGKDSMEISVLGNEERILLVARYDNLGKGASGAAIECLNIVLGVDKTLGLDI